MDPAKCLEILGDRQACDSHDHQGIHSEPRPLGGGQVIDITTGSNETRAAAEAAERIAGIAVSPPGDGTLPEQPSTRGATDRRGNGRTPSASAGDEILQGLEGMSPRELLKSFRRAQEERVALYGKFNRGLRETLRSGDFSAYPALCCEVTAGFSVLSKVVNAIEARLKAKVETKPLGDIIRRVQGHEEQLLTLTAAHHLESMREARALGMGPGAGLGSVTEAGGGAESRCDELLQEGVAQLARRVQGEAAAVTELLEELRYEAEDLD